VHGSDGTFLQLNEWPHVVCVAGPTRGDWHPPAAEYTADPARPRLSPSEGSLWHTRHGHTTFLIH
jgi:hypothetical protein